MKMLIWTVVLLITVLPLSILTVTGICSKVWFRQIPCVMPERVE